MNARAEAVRYTESAPRLAYQLRGEGSAGAPVLLIMGFGMPGSMWEPQLEGLSHAHPVACYDNRGIGDSEALRGRISMRELAADAERVLDALGWERAHVVGVSMGGMVAQHLALAVPRRLISLSLIATHAGGPFGLVPRLEGLRLFAKANLLPVERRPAALVELLYPPEFRASVRLEVLSERMNGGLERRAHPRTLRAQLLAILRHDTRRRLRGIQVPSLVIKPERDLLVRPRHSDLLAARIPRARKLDLPDGGHGAVFQCADRVNAALLAHFAAAEQGEQE
ncbi:MAG: alpha/beta fold hydrolase [Myxococcales bacterium]|nr:alpha/beta fold hydrolase [Myxococcales bacterium]